MDVPPASLEPLAVAEVEAMSHMAARIWKRIYPEIISAAQIEYMLGRMYHPDTIRSEIESGVEWRWIRSDSERIGFVSYGSLLRNRPCQLHKIYILPENQREGHGRATIATVSRHATSSGASSLELRVNRENTKAIRFYESCGFLLTGSDCKAIGGGFVMDDFLFSLPLPPVI